MAPRPGLASIVEGFHEEMPQAMAALFFLDGEYLLSWRKGAERGAKYLSPKDVAAAFKREKTDTGYLPTGVVRLGSGPRGDWFVRWIPPQKHFLQLQFEKGTRDVVVPLPGLVFSGVGQSYFLWATKTGSFDPASPLFHAPLPNVEANGQLCFGERRPPLAGIDTLEETWRMFMGTPFNNHVIDQKSLTYPGDVRKMLLSLAGKESEYSRGQKQKGRKKLAAFSEEGGAEEYPVEDLLSPWPPHFTLNDAINRFIIQP